MQSLPLSRRAVRTLAASAALLGIAAPGAAFAQAPASLAASAERDYDIAPGALSRVLTQFAAQAGIQVSVDASLTAGRNSPGLRGRQSVPAGLNALLAGTGLVSVPRGNGEFTLRPATTPDVVTLSSVTVSGSATAALQLDGLASEGYRATTVSSVGALGGMDLQNTPYAFSVVPRELLQNVQAQSPDDVYKLNPYTRSNVPQISGWSPSVSIRGFSGYNTAEDGLRRSFNHAATIEDKERVEILNGLSGFLYGAAQPGGMINYVYKRPTLERYNSVTVGDYGGGQVYVHGDFGGRIDADGRAGYRLNLVKQDGGTAIDDQKIHRTLISGALDWQLTDKLLLELNAVYNHYQTRGNSAYWFFGDNPRHGVPNPRKLWSQPWLNDEFENTKLLGKLTYRVNDNITLRGSYMRDYVDRLSQDHALNIVSAPGQYFQTGSAGGKTKDVYDAGQALADIGFHTGPLTHKVTVGYTMYSDKFWDTTYSASTGPVGPFDFSAPRHLSKPDFPPNDSRQFYAGRTLNQNFLIGDAIDFSEQWSALVGINHSRIESSTLDSNGDRSQPDYRQSRNSPSVALMYKPLPWLTTYASYNEGLEQGGTAPDTATNAGKAMPPMVSRQREIGLKATVGGMLLTGALFEIEKAYEFVDSGNTYTQGGRQNHKGVEFGATGKLTDRVTVIGGVTLLDPKVKGGDNDGKAPMDVPKVLAKLYSEYELPFLAGLSATGGIYYTGKQWANDGNSQRLPSYVTMDAGLRYATKVTGRPVTLRLNVNNLTNKNYWINSYYVGSPRSVALSAQVQF